MADGKQIEAKLMEVLLADVTLMGLLADDANSNKALYCGQASPTGVRYPALHYNWIEHLSEEKLPAGHGTIQMIITQDPDSQGKYKTYTLIRNQLLEIMNRNTGTPLTEIDTGANEGLRVVRILRELSDFGYKEVVDKHYSFVNFDIVKSEDEDFSKDFGNGSWTCS